MQSFYIWQSQTVPELLLWFKNHVLVLISIQPRYYSVLDQLCSCPCMQILPRHLQLLFWCAHSLFVKPKACQLFLSVKSAVFEFWLWNWSVKEGKVLSRKVIPDRQPLMLLADFFSVCLLINQSIVKNLLETSKMPSSVLNHQSIVPIDKSFRGIQ